MSGTAPPDIIHTASLSDVGMVRARNEDYCGEFRRNDGCRLLVMADGMGGHQDGATASRTAVETIGEIFEGSDENCEALLHDAVAIANQRVYGKALESDALRGMGTTVVVLLLTTDGSGWIAHVGDSRGYRLRRGGMEALTADHSVVGEMLRQGLITSEEAEVHPRRHEITRSVGIEAEVESEITQISVQPGDRFLLCSDGLTGQLNDEEIALTLLAESPSEAVRSLVNEANARGGGDNISVQIALIGEIEPTVAGVEGTAAEPSGGDVPGEEERRQRVRQIAKLAALVAGLLAAALLALVFSGGLNAEPFRQGEAIESFEGPGQMRADRDNPR